MMLVLAMISFSLAYSHIETDDVKASKLIGTWNFVIVIIHHEFLLLFLQVFYVAPWEFSSLRVRL